MQKQVWCGLGQRHVFGAEQPVVKVAKQPGMAQGEPHLFSWPVGGHAIGQLQRLEHVLHPRDGFQRRLERLKSAVAKRGKKRGWCGSPRQRCQHGQEALRRCTHEMVQGFLQGEFSSIFGQHRLQDGVTKALAVNENAIAIKYDGGRWDHVFCYAYRMKGASPSQTRRAPPCPWFTAMQGHDGGVNLCASAAWERNAW